MSKTQQKAFNSLLDLFANAPRDMQSVQLDIADFREVYKLTSIGKKSLAHLLDDALTVTGFVETFGEWCMAEIEHPLYQFNRVDDNAAFVIHETGGVNSYSYLKYAKYASAAVTVLDKSVVEIEGEHAVVEALNGGSDEDERGFTSQQEKTSKKNKKSKKSEASTTAVQ